MCGILASYQDTSENRLLKLQRGLRAMEHRGPDQEGTYLDEQANLLLGHKRLSIRGLSNGSQPIFNERKNIIAVVNGEFYEYQKIRKNLERLGHHFSTESDSELVVHLYEEYQETFLEHLRGEFAFILWDQSKKKLIAARDRFGIKPLYFLKNQSNIVFSSEIKGLVPYMKNLTWNQDNLFQVLMNQYNLPAQTLFKDIQQVPAGGLVILTNDGITERQYWDLNYHQKQTLTASPQEIEHEFTNLLKESINIRLESEQKVCCHLSGGIDSSTIAALSSELIPDLKCYTVAFDHQDYSEVHLARETAKHLGIKLVEIHATPADLAASFQEAVYYSEGLGINAHLPAKYLLNKQIKEDGYRVALSGEGADELLAGYAHLHEYSFEPELVKKLSGIMLNDNQETLDLSSLQEKLNFIPGYLKAKSAFGKNNLNFLNKDYCSNYNNYNPYASLLSKINLQQLEADSQLEQSTYLWTKQALTEYILNTLGDGMEMANSVEGRLPFLDHKLFEFCKNLPEQVKFNNGTEKVILRNAMKNKLPANILNRRKFPFLGPPSFNGKESKFSELLISYLDRNKHHQVINTTKVKELLTTANTDTLSRFETSFFFLLSFLILEDSYQVSY